MGSIMYGGNCGHGETPSLGSFENSPNDRACPLYFDHSPIGGSSKKGIKLLSYG